MLDCCCLLAYFHLSTYNYPSSPPPPHSTRTVRTGLNSSTEEEERKEDKNGDGRPPPCQDPRRDSHILLAQGSTEGDVVVIDDHDTLALYHNVVAAVGTQDLIQRPPSCQDTRQRRHTLHAQGSSTEGLVVVDDDDHHNNDGHDTSALGHNVVAVGDTQDLTKAAP